MRAPLFCAAALSAAVGVGAFALGQQPKEAAKPVVAMPVFTDYAPAPTNFTDLCGSADAVVVGRIAGAARERGVVAGTGRPKIRTQFAVHISAVLRAGSHLTPDATEVQVARPIGEIDDGERILRSFEPSFPDFKVGEQYVLFLRWDREDRQFKVAWGPDGAYELSNGTVRPRGHGELARNQAKLSASVLLAALESSCR